MIPLSVPNLSGNEWKYIKECLDTNWVSSVGSYVDLFEKKMSEFTGTKYAVSTVNGTAALHISLMLAGVKRSDLVIVPNITFVASANSVRYLDADPVLLDVDEKTWQLDLDLLEEFLKRETVIRKGVTVVKKTGKVVRAIMPVHVLGNMGDMARLVKIAKRHRIAVIEDATEALGSYYREKHAGTFGKCGCLSFNGNKIITTGGGGMIITDDAEFAKKAKHLTTQAKSNSSEYVHDEVGYNYRLVNLLAAMGMAQLELLPAFLKRKKQIAACYEEQLKEIPGLEFQHIKEHVHPNFWLFTVRHPQAKKLSEHLNKEGIQSRSLWVPMNRLKMYRECAYHTENNIAEQLYQTCISLPCSTNLSDGEQDNVVKAVKLFFS